MEFTGERYIPENLIGSEMEIEHLQRYMSICELAKGKIVLDAACGEGYGTSILSEYAQSVIGIDISEEAISHAKNKYKNSNTSFIQASIDSIPVETGSVDIVVSFETIEHVNEKTQQLFMEETKRVLKENGILIISTPDKKMYSDMFDYKNSFHVKEFCKKEFLDFLSEHYKHVDFYYQRFEVVSLISNRMTNQLKPITLAETGEECGKYIVAICSKLKITDTQLHANIFIEDQKYLELINRLVDNEKEILKLGNWGRQLDKELKGRNSIIDNEQQEILKLGNWGKKLDSEISILKKEIDKLEKENKMLLDKYEEQKDLTTKREIELNNLNNSINELERVKEEKYNEQYFYYENTLHNIYSSRGWRLLKLIYKIEDVAIPINSKRRSFLKAIFRMFKFLVKVPRYINKDNINNFRKYYSEHGFVNALRKTSNYIGKFKIPVKQEIKIFEHLKEYKKLVYKEIEKPLVSIIIPVYNQWDYTYSCLQSLLENTNGISYEILIADDVSSDETKNLEQYVENVIHIRNEKNLGFLLNCKNAAKYAKGKYILFLNNDTNVQKDWLKYLLDLIEKDNTIGMVGSKLVYADGRLQEAGGIIWKDGSGWNYGRFDDPEKPEYNYVKDVDYISGASIMLPTALWKEIGGFDERYVPAYCEDSDLAFEVRKHGYRVVYQPKSVVVHFEGISHGTDENTGIKSYQLNNTKKFLEKWSSVLDKGNLKDENELFWARDKSRNKKTILIIDHYVPQYDKDAGSRTMYQYIKLFVSMGLNVKFLGSNFFCHEPYTSELQELGVEVLYGPYLYKHFNEWLETNGKFIDYTYLLRPHIAVKYIDKIRKYTNSKIIYNGTDFHYIRETRLYKLNKDIATLNSARQLKKLEFELFTKSDVIYTISNFEKNIVNKKFPEKRVQVIPTYIYEDNFPLGTNTSFEQRTSITFVGGFTHTPNKDGILWFCKDIFPYILSKVPGIILNIIGSNVPEEILSLKSSNINVTGFVTDEQLKDYYSKTRVIVAPLRFGAGVKGKIIEAFAYGLPVVTTNIGAEGIMNADNLMFTTTDEKEFAEFVINTYNDREGWNCLRKKLIDYANSFLGADYARKIVEKDICINGDV